MKLDRKLLAQAWAAYLPLALTIALGVAGGVLTVIQARALSQIIDRAFLHGAALPALTPLLVTLLFIIAGRALATYGSEVSASQVAARVKTDLRERLFAHLLTLGPLYARGERTGELSNVATEGIEALDAYFSQYLPQLALAALVPLIILGFVFPLDPLSGLVLLLTAPLIPVFMILIGSLADALTRKQWDALSHMSAHFLDVLQGLTTLKMMGRSRDQIDTIAQVTARFRDATLSVLRVAFLSAFALEMVATISTAVVAVEIGLRLLYGHLSFEQAFFVLILAPEFYLPLRLLGTRFHAGTAGVAAAQRIFAILATEDGGPMPVDGRPWTDKGRRTKDERRTAASSVLRPPSSVFRPSLRIRFEDVHYAYAEEDRPALSELSFEIEPGQRVALAGPSGSGKSTVAHLLLRFMAPTRGLITVDGVPLSDLALAEWRAQVAWVPQMPYLFHDTVAANIRLARPDASRDDVSAAARLAHAHSFIEQLPLGYDTVIGERGARLSGGQAQRLALARAFLKDAPFLILDEASANLDPEHVALLQESIDRLAAGRTLLVIAHRLSTLRQADQIIVLADGHAVEVGTHATLLQRDGLYRRLALAHGGVA